MRAEIVTIGDELCRGQIVDTKSAYLAQNDHDVLVSVIAISELCRKPPMVQNPHRFAVAR